MMYNLIVPLSTGTYTETPSISGTCVALNLHGQWHGKELNIVMFTDF